MLRLSLSPDAPRYDPVGSYHRDETGPDMMRALSMSLVLGETLAAAVVALMYSRGTFLDGIAKSRARRGMRDLLASVPRLATRHRDGIRKIGSRHMQRDAIIDALATVPPRLPILLAGQAAD